MKRLTAILVLPILIFSCKLPDAKKISTFENVHWRGVFETPGGDLPFDFFTIKGDSGISIQIKNGSERLNISNVRLTADSLVFPGHIFDSEIRAKIINDSTLEGRYVRLDTKKPYSIPFKAEKGYHKRFFDNPNPAEFDFTGKWEVDFMHEGDTTKALGVFNQEGNEVYGTFLTATGDYRYLDGQVNGQTMYLSTFDGSHAFLFKASGLKPDLIKGGFWSGKHWFEQWIGKRNSSFELPDPDTLTYLKEGAEEFRFAYVNEDGEKVVRDRQSFIGKVTIIQILGTWCPNCMDETNYLVQLDGKYEDLDIIGLAFEKTTEPKYIKDRIERVRDRLNVNYPIVYMGEASKDVASRAFPMLNEIISFPTTIVIDKAGEVRRIHTGFSGPGTGSVYLKFTEEFNQFIESLIQEDRVKN